MGKTLNNTSFILRCPDCGQEDTHPGNFERSIRRASYYCTECKQMHHTSSYYCLFEADDGICTLGCPPDSKDCETMSDDKRFMVECSRCRQLETFFGCFETRDLTQQTRCIRCDCVHDLTGYGCVRTDDNGVRTYAKQALTKWQTVMDPHTAHAKLMGYELKQGYFAECTNCGNVNASSLRWADRRSWDPCSDCGAMIKLHGYVYKRKIEGTPVYGPPTKVDDPICDPIFDPIRPTEPTRPCFVCATSLGKIEELQADLNRTREEVETAYDSANAYHENLKAAEKKYHEARDALAFTVGIESDLRKENKDLRERMELIMDEFYERSAVANAHGVGQSRVVPCDVDYD